MTNNSRYSERSPDFQVETYAAVRLYLDSWRWTGVPFLIRAEKCLRNRCDGSVCKAEGIAGRRFSYMSGSCAGPYQADKSRSHRPARSQALTSMPSGYAQPHLVPRRGAFNLFNAFPSRAKAGVNCSGNGLHATSPQAGPKMSIVLSTAAGPTPIPRNFGRISPCSR